EEQQTHQSDNPWVDRRKSKSSMLAWVKTCWRAMFKPYDLAKPVDDGNSISPALKFMFFHNAMCVLLGIGVFVMLAAAGGLFMGNGGGRFFEVVMVMLGVIGGTLLAMLFIIAVWGGITHGMLRLMGNPKGKYAGTIDCLCFSNGVTLMTAIPFCGVYGLSWIAAIWWPISAGFMLGKRHEMSVGRAMIAVWIFPIIFMIGIGGLIGYSIYSVQQQVANMATQMVSAEEIGEAILKQVNDDNTIGPDHVLRMMIADVNNASAWEWQMADQAMGSWGAGFQEGCNNLSMMFGQQGEADLVKKHKKHITDALDELPPLEDAGYRFGSVLFLYNKVTTDKLDPNLWLLVVWPEHSQPNTVKVFLAGGKTKNYAVTTLIDAVDAQDTLRSELGLPQIKSLDAINIRPLPLIPVQGFVAMNFEDYDVSGKLLEVTADDGQVGPKHVLRLLMDDKLATSVFDDADRDNFNSMNNHNKGMGNWHNNWMITANASQKQALRSQIESLPNRDASTGVAGYRFGQMVMVYDGITRDKLNDELWLAVRWPKNYSPRQTRIYLADGRMIHVLAKDMPHLLVRQDLLREELGLPTIRDLNRIETLDLNIPQAGEGLPFPTDMR
ncbi:MAG: YIP1 family protein, partial [Phycisphaeraceae bacterium JB051]